MKLSKSIILVLLSFSFLISCKDANEKPKENTDPNLTITGSEWTAAIAEDGVGDVFLNIAGSTDAERVTVKTYGDGVIDYYTLTLDDDKNFSENIVIKFTASPSTSEVFTTDTVVTAHKDGQEKQITLVSPELSYTPTDCCQNNPDIDLNITNTEWHAIINENNFGEVHLNIAGSTDADSVTVETYGDGVIDEYSLTLDENKNFNEDVPISFTHLPDPDILFYSVTYVTVHKGDETEKIKLQSPALSYIAEP